MTYQSKDMLLPEHEGLGDELPSKTVLCNGQYTVEKFLNSGGFGKTYLARDSLDRKVVLKELFPDAICRRSGEQVQLRSRDYEQDFMCAKDLFQKEARALARLQHPNIVGVHQIFEANGTAYMALDYVNGVDLADLMERHPDYLIPSVVKSLLISILKALTYVHENGILHRDISPDNILLDTNGTPVLIDFGAARQNATKASRILSRVQTVKDGYSPQEFYFEGTAQSPSSDLYALAATIYHLISGAPPPNSSLRMAAMVESRTDPYKKLAGRMLSYDDAFIAGVDKCLNLFAKDRIQSAHEWLRAIGPRKPGALPEFAAPPIDPEIDKKISELVASNHRAIEEDRARRMAEPKEEKKITDREAERREAERAYWAILNEDPAELAKGSKTSEAKDGKICGGKGADKNSAAAELIDETPPVKRPVRVKKPKPTLDAPTGEARSVAEKSAESDPEEWTFVGKASSASWTGVVRHWFKRDSENTA